MNSVVAVVDVDPPVPSATWEQDVTWNNRPTFQTSGVLDTWTPVVGTTSGIDVTEAVRRAVRIGDADLDNAWSYDGPIGDIEAFHLAVTDWNQYAARYAAKAFIPLDQPMDPPIDLVDRLDGNGDGLVSAADVIPFFRRHGVSRADFTLDGEVDGADWSRFEANHNQPTTLFLQGDATFDNQVNSDDADVWSDLVGLPSEDDLTPAPWLMLKVYDVTPAGEGTTIYGSSENSNVNFHPKLNITTSPKLSLTDFSTHGVDLRIGYVVASEDFTSLTINLYRSPDGTSLIEPPLMTVPVNDPADRTKGFHELVVDAVFSADWDTDSYLVAQVEGTSQTSIQVGMDKTIKLPFAGGVFQESDGTIHVQGTDSADSVTITPTEIVVDFPQSARFPFGVQSPQYVDNEPVNTTDFQLTPPGTPPVFVDYDPNVVDAYGGDQHRVSATQTLGTTASWTFSGLAAGLYQVAVSWAPTYQELSRYVRYGVLDGTTVRHAETINQLEVPGGSPPRFQDLGRPVAVTSGTLTVTVGSSFDNKLLVDAVRIERIGLAARWLHLRPHARR